MDGLTFPNGKKRSKLGNGQPGPPMTIGNGNVNPVVQNSEKDIVEAAMQQIMDQQVNAVQYAHVKPLSMENVMKNQALAD